ncbi:MAG TPA: flagellar hook-associated protein FlgK [Povalibacter sp.]|uniref:flagellar hook-associated protein FlgK n=1 Tax=Povalibacter sp. TaxID=1962978 RepID=UPI002C0464CB|nr:flagellar hook-associated protein FlgK [Povalibacter sp.]HMN43130.1 flagellar hook-associated protein FlgK [Povalibacter sp.]
MTLIHNALSGALAAQAALSATSQNVANVMTPGYTRQGILLASVQPLQSGALSAGSGVTVPSLLRFSDNYKSLQLWSAAAELGQRTTAQPYLTQLEQVLGEDESGINSGLDAFFAALNAASVEPTSSPLRQQVIGTADALAQRFNSLNQVLSNQRASVAQQRLTAVSQVNTLSAQIAKLNSEIARTQGTGVNPSGLIDERDSKIDELASLVSVQVVEQADGTRNVSLRGGQPLVVGARAATMLAVTHPDGSQTLTVKFASETFSLQYTRLGGQMGGLDDFENNSLVPLMQSITDMAQQLADNVNGQLAAGYALDGSPGQPLFQFDSTGVTGVLQVRAGVIAADLAFSSDPAAQGNSDNLQRLIAIQKQPVILPALGSVSLADAVTQLVAQLGMDSQQNTAALATAQTVRNQAEESWKSTSGVNLDEEAANLMQYQQMYQANMKVIAVANELFASTLAALG